MMICSTDFVIDVYVHVHVWMYIGIMLLW